MYLSTTHSNRYVVEGAQGHVLNNSQSPGERNLSSTIVRSTRPRNCATDTFVSECKASESDQLIRAYFKDMRPAHLLLCLSATLAVSHRHSPRIREAAAGENVSPASCGSSPGLKSPVRLHAHADRWGRRVTDH